MTLKCSTLRWLDKVILTLALVLYKFGLFCWLSKLLHASIYWTQLYVLKFNFVILFSIFLIKVKDLFSLHLQKK